MHMNWEQLLHNQVLHGDGFFVSYNPMSGHEAFGRIGNMLQELGGISDKYTLEEGRPEETALVIEGDHRNTYHILNGDFREDYEVLVPQGLEACLKFYHDHRAERSNWSTEVADEAMKEAGY
jgi:hypothetical protein